MKTTTIILLIVLNIILIIKFEYIKKQFNKQQNNESWEKNEIAYATFKSYIYEYQKVYINMFGSIPTRPARLSSTSTGAMSAMQMSSSASAC